MSCVIFGAGKIARGFVGHLLYLSKISFVFVEKADGLVDLINSRKKYTVNILGNSDKNTVVTGARALKFSQRDEIIDEIAKADVVFTAVGGKNLGELVPFLSDAIKQILSEDRKLNIITCENWKTPANILKESIERTLDNDLLDKYHSNIGITEAVIMRSAIEADAESLKKDPLIVNVQDFWRFPFDASRIKAEMPKDMICLEPIYEFTGFLERKFYTYNAANGTTSFVGALLGYKYIADAAHDERILEILDGVYKETSTALSRKHDFPFDEQWEFTRTSLRKLQDYNIVDYIERNARDPIRKLGKDDRLVGSAKLCLEYGVMPENLAIAIACAIYYEQETDEFANQLKEMRTTKGVDYILENVCTLPSNSELFNLVKSKIEILKQRGWINE